MTTKHAARNIIVALGVIIFGSMLAVFVSFAQTWTAPTQLPPSGNVPAPINVGSDTQIKTGDLLVDDFSADDVVVGLDEVVYGRVAVGDDGVDFSEVDVTGSLVNWPAEALEVWGTIAMRGSGVDGDLIDTRITNVDSPIDDRDVANKGYVDAQNGGGGEGGITTVTLYGTLDNLTSNSNFDAQPGQGTLLCSTLNLPQGAQVIELYAGYGPHHTVYEISEQQQFIDPDAPPQEPNDKWTAIGDATCSFSKEKNVGISNQIPSNFGPVGGPYLTAKAGACSRDSCNTCRVCAITWTNQQAGP